MRKYKLIIYVVGILIFYGIIFFKFNLNQSFHILNNINLNLFLTAAFLMPIPYFLLVSYRWQLLLRTQDIRYSYQNSFIMYLKGLSAGVITPGKMGEGIKFFDLRKDGHPWQKSLSVTIIDRLIDVVILGLLACISIVKFLKFSLPNILDYALLLLISVLLLYYIYTHGLAKKWSEFFARSFFLNKIDTRLIDSNRLNLDFKRPTYFEVILIISLSIFILITSLLTAYLLALSIDISISFSALVSCYTISVLIAQIPVSIYGIGTRDMSMIALFSYYGLSSESAVAFSILLLITYAISGLMSSFVWIANLSNDFAINEKQ